MKTKYFFIIILLINLINVHVLALSFRSPSPLHPLHQAVKDNNIKKVKRLLTEEGWKEMLKHNPRTWTEEINVNLRNEGHRTALFYVKSLKMAEFLIEQGADVNAKDSNGETVLHEVENLVIVKLLIQKGADINVISIDGDTPYDEAIYRSKNNTIAKFLRSQGALTEEEIYEKEASCSCFSQ